ncbi:MAG: hypothetical protein ACRDGQ_02070, partial [Candidatus Limnocylindrales bacterium]
MRRITRVILGWTALWLVAVWVIDPASNVYGLGPAALHLQKPSGGLLFEVWAIGFVVLGSIWNKVPAGTTDQARLAGRSLRTVTWAILGWTALWIALFVAWALDPAGSIAGE